MLRAEYKQKEQRWKILSIFPCLHIEMVWVSLTIVIVKLLSSTQEQLAEI